MSDDKKPAIRFKNYSDDWEQRKFGELGSVAMCKRIFKEQTSPVGDIPFYKIGTFGAEPDAFISRELFEEYKEKFQYPKIGDMLISASGTIGRTVEYDGEEAYFQDSNIVWFKHDERVDNTFLKCIYGIIKWSGIEGSTIKRLYNDNFLKTEFYMPSVAEQEKIGEYFANLDHLITLHHRKYDKLQNLKKAMLEKMFPKNGSNVPEIRFKGFTDDWEQRKFSEGVSEIGDGLHGTPIYCEDGNVYFINGNNLVDGKIVISAETKKVNESQQSIADKSLDDTTILMSINGTIGNLAYYSGERLMLGKSAAYIKVSEFDKRFVYAYLQAPSVQGYFMDSLTGTTIKNLGLKAIREMIMFIPQDVDEQKRIGKFFDYLDHLITLHQRELEKLKNVKKAMLEKMFV